MMTIALFGGEVGTIAGVVVWMTTDVLEIHFATYDLVRFRHLGSWQFDRPS